MKTAEGKYWWKLLGLRKQTRKKNCTHEWGQVITKTSFKSLLRMTLIRTEKLSFLQLPATGRVTRARLFLGDRIKGKSYTLLHLQREKFNKKSYYKCTRKADLHWVGVREGKERAHQEKKKNIVKRVKVCNMAQVKRLQPVSSSFSIVGSCSPLCLWLTLLFHFRFLS